MLIFIDFERKGTYMICEGLYPLYFGVVRVGYSLFSWNEA